jgi:LysM repeat protein
MKIKLILFFSFFLLECSQSNAFREILPDSTKYKWIKGQKYLLHTVQPKETWNSVSQKYKLRISELMNANLGVIDLKIGQVLNVPVADIEQPVTKKSAEAEFKTSSDRVNNSAIKYSVHGGETLFSISKKFGSTVDELKEWNHLSNNTVKVGQILIVSKIPSTETAVVVPENKTEIKTAAYTITENNPSKTSDVKSEPVVNTKPEETVAVKKNVDTVAKEPGKPEKGPPVSVANTQPNKIVPVKDPDLYENPTRSAIPVGKASGGKTIVQVSESGVCSWINDSDVNQNKFYGLHRSVPIGTIVKVTNKMNDKYVFVKVVGMLPDTGDNEKSIIKISQAAVNKIGAFDAHFQVELSYGLTQ